jgi:RNA recognition motif-containing protein
VITDRDSNRSRGFAFVEMENEADAQKAIEALNGKSLDDRTIVVSVAQPKEDRGNGSRGGFQRR